MSNQHLSKHTLSNEFLSKYKLHEDLGVGGFGFVCSAFRLSDQKLVAVKFIIKNKIPAQGWAKDPEHGVIPLECYYIKRIHHPNIIAYQDYFQDTNFVYLVTELHGSPWNTLDQKESVEPLTPNSPVPFNERIPDVQNNSIVNGQQKYTGIPMSRRSSSCDLFECIEQHQRLPETKAKYIFRQIVSAIHFLHMNGVVHRDIKDENILIDSNYNVKLIDFGSASFIPQQKEKFFDRFLGTLQYAAPEIFRGEKYRGPEAEVWSLGCCLYIMLTGSVPFDTPSHAMYERYATPKQVLSGECGEILAWMLEKDCRKRPSIQQVYDHVWLK